MQPPDTVLVGRRRFTRVVAGAALLVAVGVVVAAVVIAGNSTSPRASDAPGHVTGATSVQRRDLVQTDTQAGTLSYADPQTVYNRVSGTITWLPSIGATIKTGQPLFRVDGQPVVLLDGATPAYRALGPSDSAGPDILELNRSLVELGYTGYGIVVDDTWQAATTSAVDSLQQSLGETATGTLALGKAVFLPGTQLVSTVTGTLGATQASTTVAPASPQFVSLEHPLTSASPNGSTGATGAAYPLGATGTGSTGAGGSKTHTPGKNGATGSPTSAQTLSALEALLRAEAAQPRAQHSNPGSGKPSGSSPGGNSKSPSSSPSSKGNGGNGGNGSGGGGAATAIMQTSSTKLVVTVDLSASVQSEAVVGEKVQVQMPAGNTVDGRITAVSPVAQSSSNNNNGSGSGGAGGGGSGNGSGSGSTIPVTITLNGHHTGAGLDQASVSVNFAQARAKNVLSVPVTALLAVPGGNYAVQAAAAPHKLIPVTVGLFAAGYVQISGPGIYPGLSVTDSQG
ncbi:MAG: efflux RND transporter periplasmic adaptor subunit [Solirubrobacteraceae bacterium]